jgi:hypothetical protein
MGPYISQFMVQPTALGVQPIGQQIQTFLPAGSGGSNYMTNPSIYQSIQNGGLPSARWPWTRLCVTYALAETWLHSRTSTCSTKPISWLSS